MPSLHWSATVRCALAARARATPSSCGAQEDWWVTESYNFVDSEVTLTPAHKTDKDGKLGGSQRGRQVLAVTPASRVTGVRAPSNPEPRPLD